MHFGDSVWRAALMRNCFWTPDEHRDETSVLRLTVHQRTLSASTFCAPLFVSSDSSAENPFDIDIFPSIVPARFWTHAMYLRGGPMTVRRPQLSSAGTVLSQPAVGRLGSGRVGSGRLGSVRAMFQSCMVLHANLSCEARSKLLFFMSA